MFRTYLSMKEYALYRLISYLFGPTFVAAVQVFAFAPFSKNMFGSLIIGLLFLTIFPTLLIYRKYRSGDVDIDISDKNDRPKIFLHAIVSFGVCAILFWLMNDRLMFALAYAYFFVTAIVFMINFFSKISTHTAGLAGPITAVVYYFGIFYAPLYLLLIPVARARFKLGMHNRFQLFSGAILGAVLTYAIFALML